MDVYIKESNIKNAGSGLFTNVFIPKDSLIAEFVGDIINSGEQISDWSLIGLPNNKLLQCPKSNKASYANDVILYPNKKRDMYEVIKNQEPFYDVHENLKCNSIITRDEDRFWIKSIRDIQPNDEIYVNYGLMFWYIKEVKSNDDIVYIPYNLFETHSFKKFIKRYYEAKQMDVTYFSDKTSRVTITTKNDNVYTINITDLLNNNVKIVYEKLE